MEKIISIMGTIGFEIGPSNGEVGTVHFTRNTDTICHQSVIFHSRSHCVEIGQVFNGKFEPVMLNVQELIAIQEALSCFN